MTHQNNSNKHCMYTLRSAFFASSIAATAAVGGSTVVSPASKRFMLSMFGGGAASAAPSGVSSFYDLKEKDASGGEVDFSQFRGKVVYAVNVASR